MQLFTFLLPSLLTALLLNDVQCSKINCRDNCCTFVENFPLRLIKLRSSYDMMREYYESNDDLEFALLNRTVLNNFKSPYGCHVMQEILHFYLDTVLPTAMEKAGHFKKAIDIIGNIFQELKRDLAKCRNYLTCKKPFEISSIKNSYREMKDKALYKAMGELDLLFNCIEQYLASKRQHH